MVVAAAVFPMVISTTVIAATARVSLQDNKTGIDRAASKQAAAAGINYVLHNQRPSAATILCHCGIF